MGTVTRYTTPKGIDGYTARDTWTDPATGERRWKRKNFLATRARPIRECKKEAEAWLTQREVDRTRGVRWEPSREYFGDLLDRWADALGPPLAGNTIVAYRSSARNRFSPHVRRWRVGEVSPANIRALVSQWERDELAPETIAIARHVLRSVFRMAMDERGILEDPTRNMKTPSRSNQPLTTWTPEQVSAFLESTAGDPLAYAWALLFATLTRVGELAALQWQDFDGARITVGRTWGVDMKGRSVVLDRTKTIAVRVIPLPPHVVTMLEQVHAERTAGDVWIVSENGVPLMPYQIRSHWARAVKRAGLPSITPHGARHSGATNMIAAGVPVTTVQRILGHTSASMTMNRYVHAREDDMQGAMDTLDALYRGETSINRAKIVPKVVPMVKKAQ